MLCLFTFSFHILLTKISHTKFYRILVCRHTNVHVHCMYVHIFIQTYICIKISFIISLNLIRICLQIESDNTLLFLWPGAITKLDLWQLKWHPHQLIISCCSWLAAPLHWPPLLQRSARAASPRAFAFPWAPPRAEHDGRCSRAAAWTRKRKRRWRRCQWAWRQSAWTHSSRPQLFAATESLYERSPRYNFHSVILTLPWVKMPTM